MEIPRTHCSEDELCAFAVQMPSGACQTNFDMFYHCFETDMTPTTVSPLIREAAKEFHAYARQVRCPGAVRKLIQDKITSTQAAVDQDIEAVVETSIRHIDRDLDDLL